jgi:hypothetical protein
MKRTVLSVLLVSAIATLCACTCEEEPAPGQPTKAAAKEAQPVASKTPEAQPIADKATEAQPVADKAAEVQPIADKAPSPDEGEVEDGIVAAEPGDEVPEAEPAPPDDTEDDGSKKEAVQPVEIIDPETGEKIGELQPGEKDDTNAIGSELSEAEKAEIAKQIEEGIPSDSLEPFESGDIYEGPPSKAIVGTWKIHVPKSSIPDSTPEEDLKALKDMGDITMKFDGRKATFSAGANKESFVYKVIVVTFYDMDNIILTENRYPGPARGARVK